MHGDLNSLHIYGEQRKELLAVIDEGISKGFKQHKVCTILKINERPVQRWPKEGAIDNFDRKPKESGHIPFNALTQEENTIVTEMIASKNHADDSCRVLSVKAMEEHNIYVSHVTFYNRMKDKGINGPRGIYAKRRSKHTKPGIGEVTGPNQLWSWDITFLKTTTKYMSYYLYVPSTHGNTGAWLSRVSTNLAYNCLRDQKTRRSKDPVVEEHGISNVISIEEIAIKNSEVRLIRKILDNLNHRDKLCLMLKFLGYKYNEIADDDFVFAKLKNYRQHFEECNVPFSPQPEVWQNGNRDRKPAEVLWK